MCTFYKLNLVNEYNNKYHRTIKMRAFDAKDNTYIDFGKGLHDKDPKFKVADHLEFQNTKTILLENILQISLKKFLALKKLKIHFHGHMLLMILMVRKLLGIL